MVKKVLIGILIFISAAVYGQDNSADIKKDIHYFINAGWLYHSTIKQANYEIKKYKNMELEAYSTFTGKINGITWLAPMYTIKTTDDPYTTEQDFSQWGPFYHLELQFQQPIFAFTRVLSGIKAARDAQKVAEMDVELAKWAVAKDIRIYYYGIVFAKTMNKTIKMVDETLTKAIEKAEESIAEGKTDITYVDLNKLKFFYTQVPIYRSFIDKSIEQAQLALELSTGEKLSDKDLPEFFEPEIKELKEISYYENLMFQKRPLLKKLDYGISATRNLMLLEYKSILPVLFIGGYLKYNAAPTVDIQHNQFMNNNYNTVNQNGRGIDGGIAVGLFLQLDPLKSVARGLQKKAELDKLIELKKFAMEGFPVQLYKIYTDLNDLKVKIEYSKKAIDYTMSWISEAAIAYSIGGGEAREIMEGLAAYVKAKTDYYMAVYDYNKLLGELCEITGVDITQTR